MRILKLAFYLFVTIAIFCSCSSSKSSKRTFNANSDSTQTDSLLTLVQHQTFQYFWNGAEPNSGMARERINMDGIYPENDKDVVTTGGSGFGIMAILTGIERGFITRKEGVDRLKKITGFLEKADRFHGAWPHWLHGPTGKVKPFSKKDDGGDIVETAFLVQGLLCARQYLQKGDKKQQLLSTRIDKLWKEVDWNWYTNRQNVLYWHWSPDYDWQMNFPIHGYNECLIAYILAASSPIDGVSAEVYHEGWAENGKIKSPSDHFGYTLQLHHQGAPNGGSLFWAHYSYLGLDPHGLKDEYADYWKENENQALINYEWCVKDPLHYKGYGADSWGLTSSYSVKGYAGHAPSEERDLGVIAPTAAISSIPYTPEKSIAAIKHWYHDMKDVLWGDYGFYDAFSETAKWYPQKYLAIDQGPQVVMIENYRTGLLWQLFMSCPEVKSGLMKLNFQSPYLTESNK